MNSIVAPNALTVVSSTVKRQPVPPSSRQLCPMSTLFLGRGTQQKALADKPATTNQHLEIKQPFQHALASMQEMVRRNRLTSLHARTSTGDQDQDVQQI
jgi:hypothetical protein